MPATDRTNSLGCNAKELHYKRQLNQVSWCFVWEGIGKVLELVCFACVGEGKREIQVRQGAWLGAVSTQNSHLSTKSWLEELTHIIAVSAKPS